MHIYICIYVYHLVIWHALYVHTITYKHVAYSSVQGFSLGKSSNLFDKSFQKGYSGYPTNAAGCFIPYKIIVKNNHSLIRVFMFQSTPKTAKYMHKNSHKKALIPSSFPAPFPCDIMKRTRHSGRLVAQGTGGFGWCAEPLIQAPGGQGSLWETKQNFMQQLVTGNPMATFQNCPFAACLIPRKFGKLNDPCLLFASWLWVNRG